MTFANNVQVSIFYMKIILVIPLVNVSDHLYENLTNETNYLCNSKKKNFNLILIFIKNQKNTSLSNIFFFNLTWSYKREKKRKINNFFLSKS